MSRLVASIVCEGAAIDAVSGRITAFNMFDSVEAPSLPAVLAKLFVIVVYEKEGEQPETIFERISFEGPHVLSGPSTAQVTIPGTHHTSLHRIVALRLMSEGVCRVHVEHGETPEGPWQKKALRTFIVRRVPPSLH